MKSKMMVTMLVVAVLCVAVTAEAVIVQANASSYALAESNANASSYQADMSATDLINDGQATFGSETQTAVPSYGGGNAFNDGLGGGSSTGTNGIYLASQLPGTVTFNLKSS